MSVYIAGFICALVLAAIAVIWIAYCMFIRERHKSEFYQYNISDLQHRAYQLSLEDNKPETKEITGGIFILPSRRKQKDEEYYKRPDYPESPVPMMESSTDKLVDMFNDNVDVHYGDGIIEVDSSRPYHSDV